MISAVDLVVHEQGFAVVVSSYRFAHFVVNNARPLTGILVIPLHRSKTAQSSAIAIVISLKIHQFLKPPMRQLLAPMTKLDSMPARIYWLL